MKPRQRQAAILEFLQSQGKCSVEELAQHFDTGHAGKRRHRHSHLRWRGTQQG